MRTHTTLHFHHLSKSLSVSANMISSHKQSVTLFLLLFPILSELVFISKAQAQNMIMQKALNNSVSAIFVFGDSTVDPGNNNYVKTAFRSDFPPYGQDFVNHTPTGRFTNGRLTTDFIMSYVGIKEYVPPYLDPSLSMEELMTGVSFASAVTGYDPLTARMSNVIQMSTQLDYFKEYQTRVELAIGKEKTEELIKKAVFVVSAGTNDFVVNYFGLPIRRQTYSVSSYQQFLMQHIQEFIQGLWDQGARKIAVVGLPPMGCLPAIITLNPSNALLQRSCSETYCSTARDYNQMLQNELKVMQSTLSNRGATIVYVDIYGPLIDMIQDPNNKFGFDDVSSGCCGTGLLEASFLCNPKSPVCSDASKYVFWDSIHPTEKAYYYIFKAAQSTVDFFIKD